MKISAQLFLSNVSLSNLGNSSPKCVPDATKLTLWKDQYCILSEITKDSPDPENYVDSFLHESDPHIMINTFKSYEAKNRYIRIQTIGNAHTCLKLTSSVIEAQNPCKQIALMNKTTSKPFEELKF